MNHSTGALFLLLALQPPPTGRDLGAEISLVAVLAQPTTYDGRRVTVEGWCFRGPEESALYLTADDVEYLNASNAIWLDLDVGKFPEWRAGVSVRCSVEGRVDAKSHGHVGMFPATLTDITRARKPKSRAEYQQNRPAR